MSNNIEALRLWLCEQWPSVPVQAFLGRCSDPAAEPVPQWQALGGDAGFRQYFRLHCEPSILAVFAPPATEDSEAFIRIAEHLEVTGVAAPRVLAFDVRQGFLLVEDLGDELLSSRLSESSVGALYGHAMSTLLKIQCSKKSSAIFPDYSAEKLLSEMSLFREWFLPELLAYQVTSAESKILDKWFALLVDSAMEQPKVVVHRDYHSRNLIFRGDQEPGVIDFQDAVIGPFTYDLVSLLRDCYICWPPEQVKAWALEYFQKSASALGLTGISESQFLTWFDWMGLQRHIKVLGIFARLSLRDGKHAYLSDLPLVIAYVKEVANRYSEAEEFVAFFDAKLMPLIEGQSWYRHIASGSSNVHQHQSGAA